MEHNSSHCRPTAGPMSFLLWTLGPDLNNRHRAWHAHRRIVLLNEVENEKDEQAKGDIHYDTENQTSDSYEAYNEGYESNDSVHIFITETDYIEEIATDD